VACAGHPLRDRGGGPDRPPAGAGRPPGPRPPPSHELPYGLPAGATGYGDQGDNAADDAAPILAETGGRLGPSRKTTMRPTAWAAQLARRAWRLRRRGRHAALLAATSATAE
jgi:hypothetical protein